ncbi:armadillo-type protein [Auriculariales sp. MPI-PUGE-AT-0066]|nr:armadillo-type protein [Auriculariales sp. MPI-PUGE-AT-0066]
MDAVFTCFVPSASTEDRANGYRVLAQLVDSQFGRLARPAQLLIDAAFRSPSATDALAALTFLNALFQADSTSATSIFLSESVLESVHESLDLHVAAPDVQRAIAALLSQAAAQKECREPIATRFLTWLESSSQQKSNTGLRAAAVCALTKLFTGARDTDKADLRVQDSQLEGLVGLIRQTLMSVPTASDASSVADLVEALAYITTQPAAKDRFALDPKVLAHVFSFAPKQAPLSVEAAVTQQPTLYGVAVFIRNIAAYRPQRSAEEEQVAKLRSMTREGASLSSEGRMQSQQNVEDPRDDPPAVLARCKMLIAASAVATLGNISKGARESPRIGRIVGEALLHLIDDKDSRGRALADGAASTLLAITRVAFASTTNTAGAGESASRALINVDPTDLFAAQALAKLTITASPVQVYGPSTSGALNALRPLSSLLFHVSATQLQAFEGLMALTNLASLGPDTLLLDSHDLVRRAAAELTCNILSAVPDACERVCSVSNRMQVLLALADVEDEPTRSAVAGALACIAHDPRAARAVLEKASNVARLITSDEPGLVHRGSVVALGTFEGLQDDEDKTKEFARVMDAEGVPKVLIPIVKRGAAAGPVLQPAAELLKALVIAGVKITA